METLEGIETGKYEIRTYSGTRHILDLDARSITRYGASGHEWGPGNPNSVSGLDGDPFYYDSIIGLAVGDRIYARAGGGYLNGTVWRQSTKVKSIEPFSDDA